MSGQTVLARLNTGNQEQAMERLASAVGTVQSSVAVKLVITTRVLRRLCDKCKEPVLTQPEKLVELGVPSVKVEGFTMFKAVGCKHCNRSGFKGQIGVFEIQPDKDGINLRQSALEKVEQGLTTIEEVMRQIC